MMILSKIEIKLQFKYMDDGLYSIDNDNNNDHINMINNWHSSLNFTCEIENNKKNCLFR